MAASDGGRDQGPAVSGGLLLAAGLAGLAVSLALLPGRLPAPQPRLVVDRDGRMPAESPRGRSADATSSGREPEPRVLAPSTLRGVGATAGLAAWLLVGGPVGCLVGVVVALLVPVLIARLEPASARRERLELIRAAPLVAELLAAALMAGVPLDHAVPVVARAVGGPAGERLLGVQRRVELGEPAATAWQDLTDTPGLSVVARAVARSARTGAPLAAVLTQSAEDLRSQAASAALAEVRSTAVRAVLPLGLCLLPAFALLGIAPIVGGLIPSL